MSVERAEAEMIDAELVADLREAVDALEAVDWHAVPDVGAMTAATFTLRLERARDDVLGGGR